MYPPIICKCGRSLGDLFDVYKKIREDRIQADLEERIKNKRKIVVENIKISADNNIEMGDVLDKLKLDLDCCRDSLLTWVEFKELY